MVVSRLPAEGGKLAVAAIIFIRMTIFRAGFSVQDTHTHGGARSVALEEPSGVSTAVEKSHTVTWVTMRDAREKG